MSGATVEFNQEVKDVSLLESSWRVTTKAGVQESFQGVIITMPVPQILQLAGTIKEIIGSPCLMTYEIMLEIKPESNA